MKTLTHGQSFGALRKFQLCGLEDKTLHCGGQSFTPDAATAYIEFFMANAFPLFLDRAEPGQRPYHSALHPAVIAASYRSLVGKPVNLAHLIKAYDPKRITKDHVFGTVMAVEFPETPPTGWQVQGDPQVAPCIRAVAALHKNIEGVPLVIETWNKGVTPFSETPWTVSMENEACIADGGFLVRCAENAKCASGLEQFVDPTPEDFRMLGWIYVPFADAPQELVACLRDDDIIGLKQDYCGYQTLFLNGGLTGRIFFYGVALVPEGRESRARVGRIHAAAGELVDVGDVFQGIGAFVDELAR